MFPLKADQPYPREQWWVAAYSDEIDHEIKAFTILGDRIVFYRTGEGEVVALFGYCPHRSFPFEKSTLKGDALQCAYHGFMFDKTGACIKVPSQDNVPKNSSVRRYPVIERGGLIWIWMGTPEHADATLLPDLEKIGLAEGWQGDKGPAVSVDCRYTLLIDNLLDLSHVSFIHAKTIPGSEAVAMSEAKVLESSSSLRIEREGLNLPSNPFFKMLFPDYDGPIDQHFDATYCSPSFIYTGGANHASKTGHYLGTIHFIHLITPETPHRLKYRVITARNFQQENSSLSHLFIKMGEGILPEDIMAIEAIEVALQSYSTPPRELSCIVDTGALKVRHRLERQIQDELKRS